MTDTTAGLFRTRLEADEALRKPEQAGFGLAAGAMEAAPVEAPGEPGRARPESG